MRNLKIVPYALSACLSGSAIAFFCATIASSCYYQNCGSLFSQLPQLFTLAFTAGLLPGVLKFPFVSPALYAVEPQLRWQALLMGVTALALPEILLYCYAWSLLLPFG